MAASGIPRRRMPRSTRSSVPLFFSMISWVIRIMLRLTAASSMIMDLSFIIKHPGRDLKGARPVPFNPMNLFFCFIAHFIEQNIGNNAQNQSTGNRSERDLSNRECHTADSGNQNDGRSK